MQFPIAKLALQTLMETCALIAITLNAFNVRPFLPSSDAIKWITCLPGDFFNTTPSGCLPPMYGDSRWNYPSEACMIVMLLMMMDVMLYAKWKPTTHVL